MRLYGNSDYRNMILKKSAGSSYTVQYKNMLGHSVRLDIHAVDSAEKKYNIEIQREDKGAGSKRARYNSSVMDANSLKSGADFDDLPETYVIFITENDVMGGSEPIYHVDRIVKETGKPFNDKRILFM